MDTHNSHFRVQCIYVECNPWTHIIHPSLHNMCQSGRGTTNLKCGNGKSQCPIVWKINYCISVSCGGAILLKYIFQKPKHVQCRPLKYTTAEESITTVARLVYFFVMINEHNNGLLSSTSPKKPFVLKRLLHMRI